MGKRSVLAFCVSICLCFGGQAFAKEAPEAIKVSAVLSVTGMFAGLAKQASDAYEIYVAKVNGEGGVFVKEFNKKIPSISRFTTMSQMG